MVLNTLSRSLKVTLAVLLSVVSTGLLQTAPAYATNQNYGQPTWNDVCGTVDDTFTLPNINDNDYKYKYEINHVDASIDDNKTYNAWSYDYNGLVIIELYEEGRYGGWDKKNEWSKAYTNVTCDTPETEKISYCHNENNLHLITTSKKAFWQQGHIGHAGDIFPAGSVTVNGVTQTWAAQGDQNLLLTDCQSQPPAQISYESEPGMTCDGHFTRTHTVSTPFVWSAVANAWVLDTANAAVVATSAWTFVAPLTNAEKAQLDCAKPDKPSDKTWTTTDYDKSCEDGLTKTITTYTKTYTFDVATWSWVPTVTSVAGEPIHIRDLTSLEKLQLRCDKPEKPEKVVKTFDKTRMSCENGVESKTITIKKKYVFNYIKWEWVPVVHVTHSDWTYVRDLTDAEKVQLDCVTPPVEEPETPGQVLGDSDGKTPPQVLATSTEMPATIPATGGTSTGNPYLILVAGLVAYGAVYFLQGRRQLNKN